MENLPLRVFALELDAVPLRAVVEALEAAGQPAEISVSIAGSAEDEDLDDLNWEAAFLRWKTPELHEVALLERDVREKDEEADAAIASGLRLIANSTDAAGQLIVADHLRRTQTVYFLQILPALIADDDHPGWAALDLVLRCLAAHSNGLIYAEGEGFFESDGELLLDESEDERESFEDTEEEPNEA